MDASSNDSDSLFGRLPPDLATLIFKHLDLRERMNARLVSQRWNELVLNSVRLKLRIHANGGNPGIPMTRWGGVFVMWGYIPPTTKADFVQCGSNRNTEPRHDLQGASLNERIKPLPAALMDRVFDIELRLGEGSVPAAAILDDISSIIVRPIKLHLGVAASHLTPSVFSGSATANATIVEQFPTLQLHSLSAVFKFPEDGDFSAHNYLRMDQPRNAEKYVSLKLKCCGQSTGELPFVVERFPQLTTLKMEFGDRFDYKNDDRFSAAPDWSKLSQLTSLQKLRIYSHHRVRQCAPELSKQFCLPQLRILCLDNVKLPANETFFQGTPNLNSLTYRRIGVGNSSDSQVRADMQAMTSAMRNELLKQLTDATFGLWRTNSDVARVECLQMVCKAVSQNSRACPQFQQLTWNGPVPLTSNDPDAPSLCKALLELPAGILGQRPFTLELLQYWRETPENKDECIALINAIRAAVEQSGLKRLRIARFHFIETFKETVICDLINARHPLSASFHDNDRMLRVTWMHPVFEDYQQEIEMENAIRQPDIVEPADMEPDYPSPTVV